MQKYDLLNSVDVKRWQRCLAALLDRGSATCAAFAASLYKLLWYTSQVAGGVLLIYSSVPPQEIISRTRECSNHYVQSLVNAISKACKSTVMFTNLSYFSRVGPHAVEVVLP